MTKYQSPLEARVHFYSQDPKLTAYEHAVPNATNALIAIGGLMDGPHTLGFVRPLAEHLRQTLPTWSVFEIRISSSFTGYAHGSLDRDVSEIAKLVQYLRELGKDKVAMIGHSTGSQDAIHYALKAQAANPMDGFIMQGPVSDREMFASVVSPNEYKDLTDRAQELLAQNKGKEMIPYMNPPFDFFPPLSAYRWISLTAKGGDDDYFSTDLSDEHLQGTFGKLSKPTLVLHSNNDEYVPKSVDKEALIKKWTSIAPAGVISPLSGTIPGADHQVNQPEPRVWLSNVVEKFLKDL